MDRCMDGCQECRVTDTRDYFIGWLSSNDVHVLTRLAKQSFNVIEFGAGGSTLLWAQFCPPNARIVSVELMPEWTEQTRDKLARLGLASRVEFRTFDNWREAYGPYPWVDLVFLDSEGTDSRKDFFQKVWPLLQPGGFLTMHDCHSYMGHHLLSWLPPYMLEIQSIEPNQFASAVSVIQKRSRHIVGNSAQFESLEPWAFGHAPMPDNWPPKRG